MRSGSKTKKSIINEFIEAEQVRLVGADGEQVGIKSIEEARAAAEDAKLDLAGLGSSGLQDHGSWQARIRTEEAEDCK